MRSFPACADLFLLLLQFEHRCKQLEEKHEVITASYVLLDETLQKEIQANAQLIMKCEDLDAQIQATSQVDGIFNK